jgi:WD40 repeat protein
MLPGLSNAKQYFPIPCRKSFTDTLTEGYRFDLKCNQKNPGTRSVYYYKPEHSLLISHVSGNRVHLINLLTGKIRWFDHHGTTVRSLHVCNHEIISASWDGTVCVTNFDSLKLRLILTETSMGRSPQAITSPDGSFAYSYTYDSDKNPECTSNTVRKWSLANGELKTIFRLSGNHPGPRRCGACTIFNNQLYIVSNTGYLEVFNYTTEKKEGEIFCNDELQSICAAPFCNKVLFAGNKGMIYSYDAGIQKFTQSVQAHNWDVADLMVHPDRPEILLSVSFDGTLKLWEMPDLKLLGSVNVDRNYLWTLTIVNDLLLTGGNEGKIWIYDLKVLPNIVLKGKIVVFAESYAYLPVDANSFYATDPATMQVSKKEDDEPVNSQFAEYLLNSCNNFKGFQDLFNSESEDSPQSFGYDKFFLFQLPQSFS